MKILILEDDRLRARVFIDNFGGSDLKITESAFVAIEYLKGEVFDFIFLDNDLGLRNGEGLDVADFLQQNPTNSNNQAVILIHSWNPVAVDAIKAKLPSAVSIPFNVEFFNSLDLTTLN